MNNIFSRSLRLQMLLAVLCSLAVAAVVFVVTVCLGYLCLDCTVYREAIVSNAAEQQFKDLERYVKEETITVNSLERLDDWSGQGEKVYFAVYHNGELAYESPFRGKTDGRSHALTITPAYENPKNECRLHLADGHEAQVFFYYFPGNSLYSWVSILACLLTVVTFSLCFVAFVNRKVAYINKLKDEIDILAGGQMEYPITIRGNDELGELALGIDMMRRSILRHQSMEEQMRSANSELITAMSHDLRTPLTSLTAYLEIIERKKYVDEAQRDVLIHKCVTQSGRIKDIADKMFEYFLAYATEWNDVEWEYVDADAFFSQVLEEYECALLSNGMQVESEHLPVDGTVKINMSLLQRALDNLYGNLFKYADKSRPIKVDCYRENDWLVLSIFNVIGDDGSKNESTSIGLITCRRILEDHGGALKIERNGNTFTAIVQLPLQ